MGSRHHNKWLGPCGVCGVAAKIQLIVMVVFLSAYHAYREVEKEPFDQTQLADLTAAQEYELALWAKDHPDAKQYLDQKEQSHFSTLIEAYQSEQ